MQSTTYARSIEESSPGVFSVEIHAEDWRDVQKILGVFFSNLEFDSVRLDSDNELLTFCPGSSRDLIEVAMYRCDQLRRPE